MPWLTLENERGGRNNYLETTISLIYRVYTHFKNAHTVRHVNASRLHYGFFVIDKAQVWRLTYVL